MDSRRKPRAASESVYTPSSSGPRWQIRSSARVSQAWSGSASRASARQPAIPHIVVPNRVRSWSGHRSYDGLAHGGRQLHTPDDLASLAGRRAGGAPASSAPASGGPGVPGVALGQQSLAAEAAARSDAAFGPATAA